LRGEGQGEGEQGKCGRGFVPLTSILSHGGERKIKVRDSHRKEGDL
jgi:hypothetical protein